jgi:hypothetical protein
MAEIKIFRSQTARVTPQTQPLSLRAPDQGVVGRAVSQLGEVVGRIGEERAQINAASKATAAHTGFQKSLLNLEREADGVQKLRTGKFVPLDEAETHYTANSQRLYDKWNNSLTSTYAKSLFAKAAGPTSYNSRGKFFKAYDVKLISAAVADAHFKADGHAATASDLGLSYERRYDATKQAVFGFAELAERGIINTADAVKAQRTWAASALETTLRRHMEGNRGGKGGATAIVEQFKDGTLDDRLVDKLAKAVGQKGMIAITTRMERSAHYIDTHKRQKADRAEKLAKRAIAIDTGRFYSAPDLKTATKYYESLLTQGGFDSKAEIENAQEWLGILGDTRFADKADETVFRTSTQGSKDSALTSLFADDLNNRMTHARVIAQKGNLTEPVFRTMMQKVITEHSDGMVKAKRIMVSKFKFTENMNEQDTFEETQSRAAYYRALNKLEKWEIANPAATYQDVVAEGNKLIEEEIGVLVKDLQAEFARNLSRKDWGEVLAPVPGKPTVMNAMERAKLFLAANGGNKRKAQWALQVMKTLQDMDDFGVNITIPQGQ